jgi:zinc/manganese transport system substrate-binding protein
MAENKRPKMVLGIAAIIVILITVAGFVAFGSTKANAPAAPPSSTTAIQTISQTSSSNANSSNLSYSGRKIKVVAAENFWGSLITQLGGNRVNVTSIVTDPNSDPHEYESNSGNARAIANASLVIVNGVGYDDWAIKLLSANNNPNQTVLNVGNLLGRANGTNPHLWYNPAFVNATVRQMYFDLVKIDPANASYYKQRYAAVNASLELVDARMGEIKQQFAGTKVASTESIFVYLANATGLDLISPSAFMNAMAEGDDPPVQSVVQFENQLEGGNVSVLVYNEQTVGSLTQQIKQMATQYNVTIVGVTETIQPPDTSFETWMNLELLGLQNALNANTLGR